MTDLPHSSTPYAPPPPVGPQAVILPLSWADPLIWLRLGLRDMRTQPATSLFFGLCFWAMALTLAKVFQAWPEYTLSMASGCLLLGPFLAMGLYEISLRRERGQPASFVASLTCWRSHIRSMGMLVLVLIVLELLWGRASLVVFAVFFNTGMPSTSSVMQAVFNPDNLEFVVAYTVVGGIFAMLVYSTSVVSIPMILDRDTDAVTATITSMRVVFGSLGVMLFWGGIIALLIGVSLALWGIALLVTGPLLGHASWHAYRGTVSWTDATPA